MKPGWGGPCSLNSTQVCTLLHPCSPSLRLTLTSSASEVVLHALGDLGATPSDRHVHQCWCTHPLPALPPFSQAGRQHRLPLQGTHRKGPPTAPQGPRGPRYPGVGGACVASLLCASCYPWGGFVKMLPTRRRRGSGQIAFDEGTNGSISACLRRKCPRGAMTG